MHPWPWLLNHKNKDTGETCLTRAVKSGMIEVVKVLINNPALDCNIANSFALTTACRCNFLQCVKQLVLDRRCSPEILNSNSTIVFHFVFYVFDWYLWIYINLCLFLYLDGIFRYGGCDSKNSTWSITIVKIFSLLSTKHHQLWYKNHSNIGISVWYL